MTRTFVCPACGRSSPVPGGCPVDASALVEASDSLLGRELGKFRIARILGRGGMGTVYAGVHLTIGSAVAIKVIAEEYARDAELLERFFREARAVNLIRHEGIVNILDFARLPDGRPYITMELLEGMTLRDLIRAGALPLGGLVTAMIDVLEALAAAHAIQIIHRDLKPDNVFISSGGRTKVLDFGIAKLASSGTLRTQTGVVLGTPEYMAPEQISGGASDVRTDLYAIGVMLFEGVTGDRPFDCASDYELMRAHLSTPPPVPSTLRADVPPALDDVIACALAKDPHDRFESAAAMIEALRYVASTLRIDQWLPLMPRGRLMTPRPPNPPASGPFVYLARSPAPSETTPMRPQSSPAATADATVRDLPAAGDPSPAHGPRIPGPTQAMPVAPRAAHQARRPGAETQPTRHDRPPPATPRRRPRWRWLAGAGVAATALVALLIVNASSEQGEPPRSAASLSNRAVDYDLACVAPLDYLPRARRLARSIAATAELVYLAFQVGPAGCTDLRSGYPLATYTFASSTGSCVVVMLQPTGPQVLQAPGCAGLLPLIPRCTIAELLEQARPRLVAGTTAIVLGAHRGWTLAIAGTGAQIRNDCDARRAQPPGIDAKHSPVDARPSPVDARPSPVDARPSPVEPEPTGVLGPYDIIATKEHYDPKRFDARAFYPRAVALARSRIPDAQLVRISMRTFTPDGAIELTASRFRPTQFFFESASLTTGRCALELTVFPDRVETKVKEAVPVCPRSPALPGPRCSSEQVRARSPRGDSLVLHPTGWGSHGNRIADDCE